MTRPLSVAALGIVVLAGLFLLGLSVAAFSAPSRARGFLASFATTSAKHYMEMVLRTAVGGAFVIAAPSMAMSSVFPAFGWLLVGTSLVLCVLPWRLHLRFAARVIPALLRHLPWIGAVCFVGGATIVFAVAHGGAA
jgi:hypothetical protein